MHARDKAAQLRSLQRKSLRATPAAARLQRAVGMLVPACRERGVSRAGVIGSQSDLPWYSRRWTRSAAAAAGSRTRSSYWNRPRTNAVITLCLLGFHEKENADCRRVHAGIAVKAQNSRSSSKAWLPQVGRWGTPPAFTPGRVQGCRDMTSCVTSIMPREKLNSQRAIVCLGISRAPSNSWPRGVSARRRHHPGVGRAMSIPS